MHYIEYTVQAQWPPWWAICKIQVGAIRVQQIKQIGLMWLRACIDKMMMVVMMIMMMTGQGPKTWPEAVPLWPEAVSSGTVSDRRRVLAGRSSCRSSDRCLDPGILSPLLSDLRLASVLA